MNKQTTTQFFVCVVVLGLGFMGGIAFRWSENTQCTSRHQFINSDIVCGKKDVIKKTGYIETVDTLTAYIESLKSQRKATAVSVYFRDLLHGPVFGIDELEDFAPASLLKLPLALVFFRSAETQPEVLTHSIQYDGFVDITEQRVRPSVSAEPQHSYAIEELIRMMLVYSDNASYEALEAFLKADSKRSKLRLEIFQEIGLINPADRVEETITVRGYASLFRILFNVSYLERDYSEQILAWLAESEYHNGIVAGIPADVTVAHKFGERTVLGTNLKQLHDCGIVYYPGNPYLLCIMTRGDDFTELEQTIQEISRILYTEVDSRRL